tara:strand:+ start:2004 stop:2360 length:357 start_codon:yes stop_codon:yes gene_type:complete
MKASIREEFKQRAIDYVNDGVLTNDNKEEWHFYLFNEDYYLIGNRRAENWLTLHDVSPFESIRSYLYKAIDFLDTKKVLKELNEGLLDAERVVNTYIYFLGDEWMMEEGEEFIQNYIH